jgi:hypothetical protein
MGLQKSEKGEHVKTTSEPERGLDSVDADARWRVVFPLTGTTMAPYSSP